MLAWHLPIHYRHLPHKVDGLPLLFASSVGRRVSMTLLSLFSPLYILDIARGLGFSLNLAITLVMGYFLLLFLAKTLVYPWAENLGLRFSFKGVLLFSGIPFLLFIPLLILAETAPWLLILSGILWGVHSGLFWWGYHGFFVKAGKAVSFGEEIGAVTVLETLAMVVAPIGGALIIQGFGFGSLFWVAGLIFLFSLALLVPASARRPHIDTTVKEVMGLIREHKRVSLAYVGNGAEASFYITAWPLFLFLTLGGTLEVGGVVSFAVLVAALMTFLVGIWVDKRGEREMISFGSPLLSFSWLLRMLGTSPALFVAADSLWRFAEGMVFLPLNVLSYEKALEGSTDRALLFRELTVNGGALLAMFLLVVWSILGFSLFWTFALAALFALLPLVPVRAGKIHQHKKV